MAESNPIFICHIDEGANFNHNDRKELSIAISKIGSQIFAGKDSGIIRDLSDKKIGTWNLNLPKN